MHDRGLLIGMKSAFLYRCKVGISKSRIQYPTNDIQEREAKQP
jgi:hypothetical protein